MKTLRVLVLTMAITAALSACATRSFYTSDTLRRDEQPRILMMPPDVELAEVTAAGLHETNAQWTEQGRANLKAAVADHLKTIHASFAEFRPPAEDAPEYATFVQLQKVHGSVGATIAKHHFVEATRLPAKNGKFDWSLGPAAATLGQYADANYALFVHVRDSYTSPGRVAMQVLAATLFGVGLQGGIQTGYASLVDLKTGEIVWFNFLYRDSGDLRTPQPARESVAMLLDNMPK